MKRLIPLVLTVFLFLMTPTTHAGITERVTKAYNGCMKFLDMPIARQRSLAQKLGYSLQSARASCLTLKRAGLAKSIRAEREYQRATHDPSYGRTSPTHSHEDDPYGGSEGGFGGPGVCSGGICHGPNGTSVCSGGICHGPEGTTVCSGGICHGPNGTTVCSGGICHGPEGTTVCSGGICH